VRSFIISVLGACDGPTDLFACSPTPTQAMSNNPSSSNTPAKSSTPTPALSDADLDRLLNREASAIQRELEVDRIFKAFKLKSVPFLPFHGHRPEMLIPHGLIRSPYDILDLETSATAEDVKRKYRQLSLCELPFSTRNVELCSLTRGFLYVLNDQLSILTSAHIPELLMHSTYSRR
jgi:hypothetical protein